jgi:hypothetical protein
MSGPGGDDDDPFAGRPPWARHPALPIVTFGVLGAMAATKAFADGDVEDLVIACAAIYLGTLIVAITPTAMRGGVKPLPYLRGGRRNPLVGACGGVLLVICGLRAAIDVLFDLGERSTLLYAMAVVAFVVLVAGLVLWLVTAADEWPDRWRPPWDRRCPDPPQDRKVHDP